MITNNRLTHLKLRGGTKRNELTDRTEHTMIVPFIITDIFYDVEKNLFNQMQRISTELGQYSHNSVSSALMYSPMSAWWKVTMFMGSA